MKRKWGSYNPDIVPGESMACFPSTSTCTTSWAFFFLPKVPTFSQKVPSLFPSGAGELDALPWLALLGAGLAAPRGVLERGRDI